MTSSPLSMTLLSRKSPSDVKAQRMSTLLKWRARTTTSSTFVDSFTTTTTNLSILVTMKNDPHPIAYYAYWPTIALEAFLLASLYVSTMSSEVVSASDLQLPAFSLSMIISIITICLSTSSKTSMLSPITKNLPDLRGSKGHFKRARPSQNLNSLTVSRPLVFHTLKLLLLMNRIWDGVGKFQNLTTKQARRCQK